MWRNGYPATAMNGSPVVGRLPAWKVKAADREKTIGACIQKGEPIMPFVLVQMWEGRTNEQKAQIIEKVTDALVESMGVEPEHVSVVLDEYPKENWGMGGRPASTVMPE